jgi:hypothetical protein
MSEMFLLKICIEIDTVILPLYIFFFNSYSVFLLLYLQLQKHLPEILNSHYLVTQVPYCV